MARIDLHKLALTAGFEVVCVDEQYTSFEYMVRLKEIESISYILNIKNKIEFSEVQDIVNSIIIILPVELRRKIRKLMRKIDENNIDNMIDLFCYTISVYNSKTKYSKLKEYGNLIGVDIEKSGYYFTYKLSKKNYAKILSLIESKLPVEQAPIVGKIRKIEYKIGYIKQNNDLSQSV